MHAKPVMKQMVPLVRNVLGAHSICLNYGFLIIFSCYAESWYSIVANRLKVPS